MREGRSRARAFSAATTFVLVLAMASSAHAAPTAAQERFEEGRALSKAGNAEAAIPKFLASLAAEPTSAATLNLADCYERVGKLASAYVRYREAAELARDKEPRRAEEARKRADLLERRFSTLTLTPPSSAEGLHVTIEGKEVPRSEWGKPLPRDGGHLEIVVDDPGAARDGDKHRTIGVDVPSEGGRVVVALDPPASSGAVLPALMPPAPGGVAERSAIGAPAPERQPSSSSSSGSSSALRTTGFVLGGVGIGSLVVSGVTGIVALGASSDLKDACPGYPQCASDRRAELTDLDDRARSMSGVSTGTFIAGAVLLMAGVILVLTHPPSSASRPMTAGVAW